MKRLIWILAVLLLAAACEKDPYKPGENGKVPGESESDIVARVPDRIVTAYVTYYGKAVPDGNVVTNINYSFAELYVRDGEYQGFKLQGDESRFKQVLQVKKDHPEVKICLSFSHTVTNPDNYQAGGFSVMSSTEKGRKKFAQDCLNFCINWGIDGIDIDWEMPGISWSGHACDPMHDVQNFTLLMKQLRETLGSKYLLSYAGYCMDVRGNETDGWRYMDIAAVAPYCDIINIMTYDLDGAPGHHSAIASKKSYWDWSRTYKEVSATGVPMSKFVFGVPFYARHSFDESPTAIDYNKVIKMDPKVYKIDNWDDEAQCPYITLVDGNKFFAGYDNARSIAIKADWVFAKGMKGLMYWDYDADDTKGTLRRAVWNSVMGQK